MSPSHLIQPQRLLLHLGLSGCVRPGAGGRALLVGLLAAGLVGCAGTARSGPDAPAVPPPPSAPGGDATRVSIGRASEQDIAAALRANGVDEPERWARVVTENRPYPVDDPTLTKLRQLLTRQQADPTSIREITDRLEP